MKGLRGRNGGFTLVQVLCGLLAFSAMPLMAQIYDWDLLWPPTGETIFSAAVSPSEARTAYAGCYQDSQARVGMGGWDAVGQTQTWSVLPDFSPLNRVTALAVHPSSGTGTTDTVYAGCFSSGVWEYGSHDDGINWKRRLNDKRINCLVWDPAHPDPANPDLDIPERLFIGAFDGIYQAKVNENGSIPIPTLIGHPGDKATYAIAVDPSDPLRVYVGTYGAGVYEGVSFNNGATWA